MAVSIFNSPFVVRSGIVILSLLLVSIAVSRVVYPFDTGVYAEALSWIPAQHLLAGKNPYSFAFVEPHSMSPYGIIYYALIAVGVKLFGLQLWWGRVLSVVGFAVYLWAAIGVTRKLTNSKESAAIAWLTGLAMFAATSWVGMMRSDLIAAALAATALYLAFTIEEKSRVAVWRLVAIVLLVCAAFFTKQTYLLPVCVIFLRLWQIDKRREAFGAITAFAIIVGAAIFGLNYGSAGGYVWQHFAHAQRIPFVFGNLTVHFPGGWKLPTLLFILVFLIVYAVSKFPIVRELNRKEKIAVLRSPKTLIAAYFLVSFGLAATSSGRAGASVNYYIENSFTAIVVCGLMYDDFVRHARRRLAFAFAVLLIFGGSLQFVQLLRAEYFRWQSLAYHQELFRRVNDFVKPGDVCVSIAPEFVMWNGCKLHFDDFGEYTSGWAPDLEEIFIRETEKNRYAVILWYGDKFQTVFPNYRLVPMSQPVPTKFHSVYLYVPAGSEPQ